MPKIVDRDDRRRELVAALWRVVRDQGVHHASVRAVAAESGWSPGAVRHYFSTQDELLRFAVEALMMDVPVRIQALQEDRELDPLVRCVAVIEEILPMDEQRRGEVLVWLGFTDRARFDPELAGILEAAWIGTRYMARGVVAELAGVAGPVDQGDPLDDVFLEERALALHVLIDGLCLQAISYPEQMPPAVVHAIVERELRRLMPGSEPKV